MASATLVCCPLVATSVPEMITNIGRAKDAGADLVELRLDRIRDFNTTIDLPKILNARSIPAIVTYRPKWEGGEYTGEEEPRLNALHLAADLGADFVDVELLAAPKFFASRSEKEKSVTKFIVSNHNYESTPSEEELEATADKIVATGADIVKVVTFANNITDVNIMFQVMGRCELPVIGLVMGPKGFISRVLAPKYGGYITFATLSKEDNSAPGQPTLSDLLETYKVKEIGKETKVYGIAASPVGHSKSPILHNAAFKKLGLNAVYVPYLVDDLSQFLSAFNYPDYVGFSVSLPHKEAAIEAADEVEALAKQIGACNTLIRGEDGKFSGYNTDCVGALRSIEVGLIAKGKQGSEESALQGKTLVVIGAGGAGKALAYGGKVRGAEVIIANRTITKAEALAENIGGKAVTFAEMEKMEVGHGFLLANSTSVGMQPNFSDTPCKKEALKGYELVFDAVYTPRMTRLLKEAGEQGAIQVSGVEMFIGQAILQFELFTGATAPIELMREIIEGF